MYPFLPGRRNFLKGLGALALGVSGRAMAETAPVIQAISRQIEVKGRAAKVFGIMGPDGKPGLDLLLGALFRARLENRSGEETLVHWHGLKPPAAQDGVPLISQATIGDGGQRIYEFENARSGTHWMHSHVGLQEQLLLAAPLIVRETAEPIFDEDEHVVMLHDFTFRDPAEIMAGLRKKGSETMMPGMDMGPMLNDVIYDAYLANDRTLDDPEIVSVKAGRQLRLRIINGASASNMWIDLGTLEGQLVAVDGNALIPVRGSMFPLAIAQRADIRVIVPKEGGAFPILFRPEGVSMRTGIVLASKGAHFAKIAGEGMAPPGLDLAYEMTLKGAAQLPKMAVTRRAAVDLTGSDMGYTWGFNGSPEMDQTLFEVAQGDRVEVTLVNKTEMAHPMHLHGHYFKVVAIGDTRVDGAIRDTILVPPKAEATILFDADNPGTWAFHCHHLYHMNAGMMALMKYA